MLLGDYKLIGNRLTQCSYGLNPVFDGCVTKLVQVKCFAIQRLGDELFTTNAKGQ